MRAMPDPTRHVRQRRVRGEAPGRGQLRGRRILVVGSRQTFDAATVRSATGAP
jgi:hypothetical protein